MQLLYQNNSTTLAADHNKTILFKYNDEEQLKKYCFYIGNGFNEEYPQMSSYFDLKDFEFGFKVFIKKDQKTLQIEHYNGYDDKPNPTLRLKYCQSLFNTLAYLHKKYKIVDKVEVNQCIKDEDFIKNHFPDIVSSGNEIKPTSKQSEFLVAHELLERIFINEF